MDVLSVLDVAFLDAEDADKHVSMAISSIAVFDGTPPSREELVDALSSRLPLVPRYCQRVRRFPFDLAAPVWVNDPTFDIKFHVRRAALPAPGGDAELNHLVALVTGERLDRDHPLWEVWVVEGLADAGWALLSKVHHCMVDGVAGTELYHLLLSPTPAVDSSIRDGDSFSPPPGPGRVQIYADAARRAMSKPASTARAVGTAWRQPRRLLTTGRGLASLGRVVRPAAPSTLVGAISSQRRYATVVTSLEDIRRVSRAFDVTVNDVALAAITAGFRTVLLGRHELPSARTVRSLVPASVRAPGTERELANRVSCMFVDLPVHVADPIERLRVVHDQTRAAKEAHEAEAGEALVEFLESQPFVAVSAMLRAAFRLPQRNIVTVTTNVPGPQAPLYLLGRKMIRLLPFVPIADRVRFGVAMLSYCGQLAFGLTGDYGSASDLNVLARGIRADLDAFSTASAVASA